LDGACVSRAVDLCAGGAYRRALAPVEDAELDPGFIGGLGHYPAERVDLGDKLALAGSADGGVAAHQAGFPHGLRHSGDAATHPHCSKSGLAASVAQTHDH
jgi:hypothetical protein